MLYHRLATLKHLASDLVTSEPPHRLSPLAVQLGLAIPMPVIDDPAVPRGKNFYECMLELCEKYFEGDIDSYTFEENLRYMWGIKAFPAFTIDKVIGSMIKHVHSMNTDARCHQLIDLLKVEREAERITVRHSIVYRHACEEIVGLDENLFRIEWVGEACA